MDKLLLTISGGTLLWLFTGFVFCILAVRVFRKDGTTTRPGELYMAVVGPLFGPIIGMLILIDLMKPKGPK